VNLEVLDLLDLLRDKPTPSPLVRVETQPRAVKKSTGSQQPKVFEVLEI
jgi:hypothetical protein